MELKTMQKKIDNPPPPLPLTSFVSKWEPFFATIPVYYAWVRGRKCVFLDNLSTLSFSLPVPRTFHRCSCCVENFVFIYKSAKIVCVYCWYIKLIRIHFNFSSFLLPLIWLFGSREEDEFSGFSTIIIIITPMDEGLF